MSPQRILVALDGSPNSLVAATWARDLAEHTGAELIAVHALGLLEHLLSEVPVPTQQHQSEVTWAFEHQWAVPLARRGTPARSILRDGPAADVILSVAADEHADLIVVGTRGCANHPERALGSVATQLVQRATCPVTVVPHH